MKNRFTEECPICVLGKNSKRDGGNENCFHCNKCWFIGCEDGPSKILKTIKTRLESYYK